MWGRWEKHPGQESYIWEFVRVSVAKRLKEVPRGPPSDTKEVSKPCLPEHSRIKVTELRRQGGMDEEKEDKCPWSASTKVWRKRNIEINV